MKNIVSKRFYKWSKVFEKQNSERMSVKKPRNYAIDLQEMFILRKRKIYLLSRIKRKEVQAFIDSQLKKNNIQSNKLPQTKSVMFVLKKDRKRKMV